MDDWQATIRVRRRRRIRYRKICAVVFVLVVAVAVMLIKNDVASNGKQEWVGGRRRHKSTSSAVGAIEDMR